MSNSIKQRAKRRKRQNASKPERWRKRTMIRLFFKRVLGKDGFPFFVFRKAASEVVYAANVFRFLLMFPFLKLRNHRLRNRIKRLETAIAYVNGRSRT